MSSSRTTCGQPLGTRENIRKIANAAEQLAVLGDDLVLLEPREPMQAHVENGLRLRLGQPVAARRQAQAPAPARSAASRSLPGALQQLRHDAGRPGARQQACARLAPASAPP